MAIIFKAILLVAVICVVDFCSSDSLQVGNSVNARLAYIDSVKLSSVPFTVRTKNVFYNGNDTIKGIMAIDMIKGSKSKASITSGGVGATFTNIKLKSERGGPINYQIQIFV